MTKLVLPLAATAALAGGLAALSAPAVGQDSDRISEIIVYGNDPCPRSNDDDIVVCARKPESERYRIPERLRTGGRALETVGATGINSCSPVGPAGFTGCLVQVIKQARQETNEAVQQGTAPEE